MVNNVVAKTLKPAQTKSTHLDARTIYLTHVILAAICDIFVRKMCEKLAQQASGKYHLYKPVDEERTQKLTGGGGGDMVPPHRRGEIQ